MNSKFIYQNENPYIELLDLILKDDESDEVEWIDMSIVFIKTSDKIEWFDSDSVFVMTLRWG